MALYQCASAAMATTAAPATLATGTVIKTLLQLSTPATARIAPVAWGISFSGSAAGTPILCELVETNVAATVTAHVASAVQPYDDPGAPASLLTLGTSATGFNASVEGTITSTRHADLQQIAPTNQYVYMWPLSAEFKVAVSRFLRVRVTAAATVNAWTWIRWEEAP